MTNEKAIDLLDNLIGMVDDNHHNNYDEALKMGIEALKHPVIHAKWLNKFHRTPRGIILPDIECDNCHNCTDKKYKYCPNCGAKMDGGSGNVN